MTVVIFSALKTADLLMHHVEHRALQRLRSPVAV